MYFLSLTYIPIPLIKAHTNPTSTYILLYPSFGFHYPYPLFLRLSLSFLKDQERDS